MEKNEVVTARDLSSRSGWRLFKVIFVSIFSLIAIGLFVTIPGAYKDCQWQHTQYLSQSDPNVPHSFFETVTNDCKTDSFILGVLVFIPIYLLIVFGIYLLFRRIARYVLFGTKKTKTD